jgi:hypothetical protein
MNKRIITIEDPQIDVTDCCRNTFPPSTLHLVKDRTTADALAKSINPIPKQVF